VSDPVARACNGPAPVRRGRSRHGRRCQSQSPVHCVVNPMERRPLSLCTRSSWPRIPGRSGPPHTGIPVTKRAPFGSDSSPLCAGRSGQCDGASWPTLGARDTNLYVTRHATPAITRSMLELCSAPCKALRFASTARARGLRALTVPARSSRISSYVMTGGVKALSSRFWSADFDHCPRSRAALICRYLTGAAGTFSAIGTSHAERCRSPLSGPRPAAPESSSVLNRYRAQRRSDLGVSAAARGIASRACSPRCSHAKRSLHRLAIVRTTPPAARCKSNRFSSHEHDSCVDRETKSPPPVPIIRETTSLVRLV
jgi:hypothetical protein